MKGFNYLHLLYDDACENYLKIDRRLLVAFSICAMSQVLLQRNKQDDGEWGWISFFKVSAANSMLPLSTALSFHWTLHKRQQPNAAVYTVSEWNYYGGNGRMTTSIPPMGAVSSWNTRIICWVGSTGVLDGGIGSRGGVDVGIKPMSGDRKTESVWMCVWSYILPCKGLG